MFGKKRLSMLEAGAKTPAFELKELNGATRSIDSILQNGPALVAFFKIGCPVCQLTFPYLQRLAANEAVQVVGISQDEPGVTKNFNQRFGVTFPTLVDEPKAGYPVSNAFGIDTVPSLFVLEQDGRISKSFAGFSKKDLEAFGERVGVRPFAPDEKVPEFRAG